MNVGGSSSQEVDLNLAPIIDCFTVLITYLLVTASFLTLAAVDVNVSETGAAPAVTAGQPPMSMMLEIKAGGDITIAVQGGTLTHEIDINVKALQNSSENIEELESRLRELQSKWPAIQDASVTADPTVIYKNIVETIHKVQSIMPKVYISS